MVCYVGIREGPGPEIHPATMILPASAQGPLTQVKSQSGTNPPSSNVSMAA
jgi:hypothetical protein